MSEASSNRRAYDSPARRRRAEQTRDRILTAGSELVHEYRTWDWRELTFRAVAERAGVGERTVYRHFPTERHLHDAVMRRLEDEAGVDYHGIDLANLTDVTGRFFASLQRFTVDRTVPTPAGPAFAGADERRRRALLHAVAGATPDWPEDRRRAVAGVLDVLWSLPSYERLADAWDLSAADASGALNWLIDRVIALIQAGDAPPAGQ
ncbi:TetR/AcrR family transcriptional regulator [Mycolicibacterium austroafricanum]|uniref:TetR/AcrR family transcriptional regulator n=2 Tax=Mycolicibacterium TaxID=1866885 RepID=A0ABT8H625_MYCAO|nr:TetR/AcrR family transcriptional regulator [Mycolicibacterium austroafricanum]MDN4516221.1 TetR/AcrR family transcriptional regulator [Mycolicibacterium austroafricanum]QRZ08924.1 TetR/AcrR family transcriptional regulator [Mycolicibacterium austroafricanum]QZT70699.1 TetR/AcrR family transcriptional regulator [Mycolicibacterium austroafricanum]